MLDRISTLGNRLLARLVPNTVASAAQCYYVTGCHPIYPCYRRQCCISAGQVTCGGCRPYSC